MSPLLQPASLATNQLLLATFCVLAAQQTVLAADALARGAFRRDAAGVALSALLVLHLVLCAAWCDAYAYGEPVPVVELGPWRAPVEGFLWLNLLPLAAAARLVRSHGVRAVAAAALAALWLPPVWARLGALRTPVELLDAVAFCWHASSALLSARATTPETLTRASVTQALTLAPEGIACHTSDGRLLFMNDAMRSCLGRLGLPTDLGDMRRAWGRLEALARAPVQADGCELTCDLPSGEVRLFQRYPMSVRGRTCTCLIALDVTEEDALVRSDERVNRSLELARDELARSIRQVQEVAEGEARAQMVSRVHDVVGQRLSILHRYLEDDALDEAALGRIEPLLESILQDLGSDPARSPQAELAAMVDAFGSVGVALRVTGSLPADAALAGAFVRVIREATTNAVRHGQARAVAVTIDQTPTHARLVVTNDGAPLAGPLAAHGGIGGMRREAAALRGTLEVTGAPQFTVVMRLPVRRGA